jgi:hypothetical protein
MCFFFVFVEKKEARKLSANQNTLISTDLLKHRKLAKCQKLFGIYTYIQSFLHSFDYNTARNSCHLDHVEVTIQPFSAKEKSQRVHPDSHPQI